MHRKSLHTKRKHTDDHVPTLPASSYAQALYTRNFRVLITPRSLAPSPTLLLRHVVELAEVRHRLRLGIQLLPRGDLLKDLTEDVPRRPILRPQLRVDPQQVARLFYEILEVLVVALIREVREADLVGGELVVEVEVEAVEQVG